MSHERITMRDVFFQAWRKHREGLLVEPLEQQLIDIIQLHPEYHALFMDRDNRLDHDFGSENPFLHLSLHSALREQIQTDRPAGIQTLFKNLLVKNADQHSVEHKMMACLEQVLWQAQQTGKMPDEQEYLRALKQL